MNVLIQLSHPAQFHLYKNVAANLIKSGNKVFFVIKTKDILEDLLKESGFSYYNILKIPHRHTRFGILVDTFIRDWRMAKFVRKNKIDLLTGSTVEVAHVGWLMRKDSINTGEDDLAVVPQFGYLAGPFVKCHLAPMSCDVGSISNRCIKYAGYQKLAYLHPNHFIPNRTVAEKYVSFDKPYFLLRLAKLTAFHDLSAKAKGMSVDVVEHLLDILSEHGNVYITSEGPMAPQFEKYRLNIKLLDIHHVLAFAKLYIGDSQSMAVEAAMLGTPSIRFNDFVGKIGILEELEHSYELVYSIFSSEPQRLYNKVEELLNTPNLQELYQQRRYKMLADKIDVTAFFTWFIENYPESRDIMKKNPDYQLRFK